MKKVYLCGIGGIGMANFAVLLKEAGLDVTGSDGTVYEPAASILRQAGISVCTPYSADNVRQDGSFVVVGNAQSRNHVEIEKMLDLDIPLWSFPDFLARHVMSGRHRMVVAGTHGKSSTTACLAHVLRTVGSDCGFLIGALPVGAASGAGIGSPAEPFVLEGDEYDAAFFDKRSKFLHYYPRTLLLGTVEYDHADIFPAKEDMLLAFRRLIMLLPKNGTLIYHSDCAATRELANTASCRKVSVGKSDEADWQLLPKATCLTFRASDAKRYECAFALPGEHQRLNALMALAAAQSFAPNLDAYMRGLATFRGLRRRLEKLFASPELTIYDDFAHHPTAIAATLIALREHYAGHRLIAVVEPRSNTMVRNIFQRELPSALNHADHVILGSIHRPERIPAAERLDIVRLQDELQRAGTKCHCLPNEGIVDFLMAVARGNRTVVVFMSNGDFGSAPQRFVQEIQKQHSV